MTRPENKYPQRMLKLIKNELEKELTEKKLEYSYSNLPIIEDTLKKFGIFNIEYEEFGFWLMLVEYNRGKGNEEELVIPKISKYEISYNLNVRKYITEYWAQPIMSYDEDLIKSQVYNDDDFDYYSGDFVDDDVYDSETTSFEIENITEIPINEGRLKNSLLENRELRTKEIGELENMKKLIEERLRILRS